MMMRKIFMSTGMAISLSVWLFSVDAAQNQTITPQDIISKCAEAIGGIEKIEGLKTVCMDVTFPGHGDTPSHYEIKRPNLVRYGDRSGIVFDGNSAYILRRQSSDGTPLAVEIVDAEEWKDFEVEIAWFIPAFYDYPAEYLGFETIENKKMHMIGVTLPLGARMTYWIDGESYLIVKIMADVTLHNKARRTERDYGDYKDVDGILFPHKFSYKGRVSGWATIENVEMNCTIPDDRIKIPVEIQ